MPAERLALEVKVRCGVQRLNYEARLFTASRSLEDELSERIGKDMIVSNFARSVVTTPQSDAIVKDMLVIYDDVYVRQRVSRRSDSSHCRHD